MSRLHDSDWKQSQTVPSDNDDYLVYTQYGQVFIAKYSLENKEWSSNDLSFSPGTLTHWHLLPESPKK